MTNFLMLEHFLLFKEFFFAEIFVKICACYSSVSVLCISMIILCSRSTVGIAFPSLVTKLHIKTSISLLLTDKPGHLDNCYTINSFTYLQQCITYSVSSSDFRCREKRVKEWCASLVAFKSWLSQKIAFYFTSLKNHFYVYRTVMSGKHRCVSHKPGVVWWTEMFIHLWLINASSLAYGEHRV